jgi:hypothetical protein
MRFSIAALLLAVPAGAFADARSQLGQLADSYVALGQTESARQLQTTVDGLSDAELEATFGPVADQLARLIDLNTQIALSREAEQSSPVLEGPRSPGFPQPMFSANCPESMEKSFDDLFAARIVLTVAKGVWAALSRACDEVIVAIGVGGNLSIPCIIADEILFAAEETFEFIDRCNDDIAGARADAVFARTEHIHDDLADHDADIKAELAIVQTQLVALQGDLALLLKTQLEEALHLLGGARMGVTYTDRLAETCAAAQEAIDDALGLGYQVNPAIQALHDAGVTLIPTDPKKAYDLCRQSYKNATRGSTRQ